MKRLQTSRDKAWEGANSTLPDILEVRQKASNWWIVAIFLAIGVLSGGGMWAAALATPKRGNLVVEILLSLGFFAFWATIGGVAGWYYARWRIVATPEGLSCRGMFREHYVPWEQVRDYYTMRPKNVTYYYLETGTGQKISIGTGSDQDLRLRQAIVERARWAETSGWKLKGARLAENETRFFCIKSSAVYGYHLVLASMALIIGLHGYLAWSRPQNSLWMLFGSTPQPAWAWILSPAIIPALLYSVQLLPPLLVARSIRVYALRYWQAQVSVSPERIRWSDGSRSVDVHWSEITACRLQSVGLIADLCVERIFETPQGSFSITPSAFKDGDRLGHILESYLPPEVQATRPHTSHGSARMERDGSMVFDYRTPSSRAFLWFVTPLCLFYPGINSFYRMFPALAPPGALASWTDVIIGFAVGFLLISLCLFGYFRSQVVVRGEWLEHRTFCWTRKIPMAEIQSFQVVGLILLISTAKKTLVLGGGVSDPEGLKRAIKKHAKGDLAE